MAVTRASSRGSLARLASILPVAVSLIPASHHFANTCGLPCGTERWAIKTMSDAGANTVILDSVPTSVSALVNAPAPDRILPDFRVSQMERQTFTVSAKLLGYQQDSAALGSDQDLRLVLQDPASGETMIAAIPNSACQGVCQSVLRDRIGQVRTAFASAFPNSPANQNFVIADGSPIVEVTGVGMFDRQHNQPGGAKNCIELQPVFGIKFDEPLPLQAHQDPQAEPKPLQPSDYHCPAM